MAPDIDRVIEMEAHAFNAWVGGLTDADVQRIPGPDRERLLDHVFGGIPKGFSPERASGRSARVIFHITGDEQPNPVYAVVVEDGVCRTEKDPTQEGGGALRLGLLEFLRLITGRRNPVTMVMFGKISVSGELSQVMAFQQWFNLPR